MNLAIQNITNGGLSGGYIKYLKNIVPLISKDADLEELNVYVPSQSIKYFENYNYVIPYDNRNHLKKLMLKSQPDIIFSPSIQYLKFKKTPLISMIRNMEPLDYFSKSNPPSEKFKNILRKRITAKACHSSDGIIAVSNYVKEYLINNLGIDENKIKVIYHGGNYDTLKLNRPRNIDPKLKYIFTAGSIRPARGLIDVLKAFKILSRKYKKLNLVIAGASTKNMMKYEKKLLNFIQKNNLVNKVLWVGHLNEHEINWCYQNSRCFVMTSRVEACTNIAIEAMTNGALVISTKNKPMPEFFKDNAHYYQSGDFLDLSEKIKTLINLEENKKKLLKTSIKERGDFFSWEKTARETILFLKKNNG